MRQLIIASTVLLAILLGWVGTSWDFTVEHLVDSIGGIFAIKGIGIFGMYLFLPLTGLTYYGFRQQRQTCEVERLLGVLALDPLYERTYLTAYRKETSGAYFLLSVAYASVVSVLGLMLLFWGHEMFPARGTFLAGEFPTVALGDHLVFPARGSRLISGMAFLGAYIWGLQYVLRRYALNDLVPNVYYSLSMRMTMATLVTIVIYNAYEAIANSASSGDGMTLKIWPALAFMLGMFPQRGLRWLTERLPIVSTEESDAVRKAPLAMIEGIESQDKMRLEELGLDSCYDLAVTDFVPLILNTPYGARQLVDWILQAKLCVYFADGVKDLRPLGIRTILDLEDLTPEHFETLARDTSVTKSALQAAQRALRNSPEIKRLQRIENLLSQFSTKDETELELLPKVMAGPFADRINDQEK